MAIKAPDVVARTLYGYELKVGQKKETPNEHEQMIISKIIKLYTETDRNYSKVAAKLNNEKCFRRGRLWSRGSVRRVIIDVKAKAKPAVLRELILGRAGAKVSAPEKESSIPEQMKVSTSEQKSTTVCNQKQHIIIAKSKKTQSPRPLEKTQSSRPLEKTQSACLLEKTQSSCPLEKTQLTCPLETNQSTCPSETNQSACMSETNQSACISEKTQSASPLETNQSPCPLEKTQLACPLEQSSGEKLAVPDSGDDFSVYANISLHNDELMIDLTSNTVEISLIDDNIPYTHPMIINQPRIIDVDNYYLSVCLLIITICLAGILLC